MESRLSKVEELFDEVNNCGHFYSMGTVAEIEKAVANLPLKLRRVLLRHLHVQFGQDGKEKREAASAWPVPPPKVSKAESKKVARRIADEFGRVEPENWRTSRLVT